MLTLHKRGRSTELRLFYFGRTDMKKSCPYCGRIHERRYTCPLKPEPRRSGRHNSVAGDLRKKNIWTRKSKLIRERDYFCCRYCLEVEGQINSENLSVHHIDSIKEAEESWLDDDNLITLCNLHHEEAEKGIISREKLKKMAARPPEIIPPGM